MSHEPTVIYSAANTQQAHLLRGLLEEEGIQARVVNDALQFAGGELPLGWTAAARVVVPEQDAARARQIAADFDHQISMPRSRSDVLDQLPIENWSGWPTCSSCGMRRSAQCPTCGATGTDFPLADFQPDQSGDRILLFCRSCDDHTLPAWYRFCPGCHFDFGSGLEVAAPPPPLAPPSWPQIAVAAVLLSGALLFAVYFWWLLA